jgi:hypothetical protein
VSGSGNSSIVFLAVGGLEARVVARDLLPCGAVSVAEVPDAVLTPTEVLEGTRAALAGVGVEGALVLVLVFGTAFSDDRLEAFLPEAEGVLVDVAVTTDLRRASSSCCCSRT